MECALEQPLASRLYREHGPAIRAYLASKLRDSAAAEDLCQETFVVALAKGVPDEGAGRWLFGIARNKVLRQLRDRKPTAPLAASPATASAQSATPVALLDASERRARVRAAVASLADELREVVALRYEGGLDYKGIADRLELPVSTVQGRLKRARVALRGLLREEDQ